MKRILYLGLKPTKERPDEEIIHYPVITTKPKNFESQKIKFLLNHFNQCTHLIITSKNGFKYLLELFKYHSIDIQILNDLKILSVGNKTSSYIQENHFSVFKQAKKEQAEGIIEILETLNLQKAILFWPHSEQARPLITNYCHNRKINIRELAIYDTLFHPTEFKISLDTFHEIFFTSPSTVDAFFQIFDNIPNHLILKTIGPVTENYLQNKLKNNILSKHLS